MQKVGFYLFTNTINLISPSTVRELVLSHLTLIANNSAMTSMKIMMNKKGLKIGMMFLEFH